jgi:hypothetical protein
VGACAAAYFEIGIRDVRLNRPLSSASNVRGST